MNHPSILEDEIDLEPGASNAVQTCMNVQPGERVLILGDESSAPISAALADAARTAGAVVESYKLEDFDSRPILSLPDELSATVKSFNPDVSFYTASAQPGELQFRQEYRKMLQGEKPTRVRHGHMINVTPLLMEQGMQVDYRRVYAITMAVTERARQARSARITNPKGTDFRVTFDPERRWVPCHGLYHRPGEWGNLPEGETFTAPSSVDGVLVADLLGDYFSEKYGVLETPVTFTIRGGFVEEVSCINREIQEDVEKYLFGAESANRVGEFAIGTNVALTELVGNLLQDEKYPGVHVAFGDPYAAETGADWSSPHHMDVIPTECSIELDGEIVMEEGVFVDSVLAEATRFTPSLGSE